MGINSTIDKTKKELDEIEQVLLFIDDIKNKKPKVVLHNTRMAAEYLCKAILRYHNQDIAKTTLDPLIVAVSKIDNVPKNIIVSLRTIQHYGNLGSHDNDEVFDITPCVQALINVVNWYFADLQNVEIKISNILDFNQKMKKIELEKRNKLERLSFCLSLETEDKEVIDDMHDYLNITRFDILNHESNNYTSHRWLTIQNNKQDKISEYLIHQESGENKINFTQFNMKAYNTSREGQELSIENLVNLQPSFVQKVKINFNNTLQYLEKYNLYYRLSWPGELLAYSGNIHSQSISFSRILGKVYHLKFGIFTTLNLIPIKCIGVTNTFDEINLNLEPIHIVAEDILDFSPIHNKGYKGFFYEIDNTLDLIAVRIYYTQEVIQSHMEEDF
jgi:hypothetical protein